jgi:hypothetical protein
MHTFIQEFVTGSPAKRLAIIADITTILGVSVGATLLGPFSAQLLGKPFRIADFIIAVLFYFVLIGIGVFLLPLTVRPITQRITSKYIRTFAALLWFLVLSWAIIRFFPETKVLVGAVFRNDFLLPPTGKLAVKEYNGPKNLDTRASQNKI